MGEDPNAQGNSRRWIIQECENSLRRLGHRLDRPVPDPPAGPELIDIDETLGGAERPRAPGQGPLHRLVHLPGRRHRRGPVGGREARPRALRLRAAALLAARPRASRPTCSRPSSATAWAPSPGARWPAAGSRATTGWAPRSPTSQCGPSGSRSATTCRNPSNQRKLEVAEQLAKLAEDSGMSLVHLAVAFVIAHPGVTSAIIGPRTMEQLETQLGAADVTLGRRRARRHRPDQPARAQPQPGRRRVHAAVARSTRGCAAADQARRRPGPDPVLVAGQRAPGRGSRRSSW